MTDQELIARIVTNPRTMVGKPVIRGTRLTVEYVLGRLAHGAVADDLIHEYPGLTGHDIQACLMFASHALDSGGSMPPQMQPSA